MSRKKKEVPDSAAKPRPEPEARLKRSRGKDLSGLALVFLTLYLLLAFASYHPDDGSSGSLQNWTGILGHAPVDAFVRLAGVSALGFVLLPAVVGIGLLRQLRALLIARHVFGVLLVMLASSVFAEVFWLTIHFESRPVDAGGKLGMAVAPLLLRAANKPGTAILTTALFLIGALLATGIPLRVLGTAARWIGGALGGAAVRVSRGLAEWFQKRLEQKRRHKEFLARRAEAEREAVQDVPRPPQRPAAAARSPKERPKRPAYVDEPSEDTAPPAPARKPLTVRKEVEIRPRETARTQPELDMQRKRGKYELPPTKLMNPPKSSGLEIDRKSLEFNSRQLEKKLGDFNVQGQVVAVQPGPVVTMYELEPAPGVKVQKFVSLTDDIAMAMRAVSVRIVAPIPGKNCVGIEIPNNQRETVFLREIIESSAFQEPKLKIPIALGKDISGEPVVSDLAQMPHLLVAGSTGSGKSVSVNAMILSILYRFTPEQVKFIMVDPKMIELSAYDGIPHLRTPVVTNPKKAAIALRRCVDEMERRYALMKALGRAKDLETFNRRVSDEIKAKGKIEVTISYGEGQNTVEEVVDLKPLPYWVIIIDELADLMMVAKKDIEDSIARLTAKARAAGLHLIVATQRPSVDVITGVIKSNLPTRLSFQVASGTDSRTIIDGSGAENLLGQGDSLFIPPKSSRLTRVHGAYVGEEEIAEIVEFLRRQGEPEYDEGLLQAKPGEGDDEGGERAGGGDAEKDPLYDEIVAFVMQTKRASTSAVQRKFSIGYNRAARVLDQMQDAGLVGPPNGSNPREILRESL